MREKGHPIQLINAFERPVRSSNRGFAAESVNLMNCEYADIKETWGVDAIFSKAAVRGGLKKEITEGLGTIETCSLDELIDGMVQHVI